MAATIASGRAYEIASSWGSFITSGDPGACFYGFAFNDGRPQSEKHRADCLRYLDTLWDGAFANHGREVRHDHLGFYVCTQREARYEDEGNASVGFDGRAHWSDMDEVYRASRLTDVRELVQLRTFLRTSGLR